MAKWSGAVGYSETTEVRPGVWENVIKERHHVGDLLRNIRRTEGQDRVLENVALNNAISIVADPYAMDHFFSIQYITLFGKRFRVGTVTVEPPRLVLQVGEVYHGPTP